MCRRRLPLALYSVALLWSAFVAGAEPKLLLDLTVDASGRERVDAIASFPLPESLATRKLRLVETTGHRESPVAAQVDEAGGRLYWIANGKTAAGSQRTYRLQEGTPDSAAGLVVSDSADAVEATFDGKSLLRYNKAHVEPPAGVNPKYGRSAHLHPVRAPSGAIITDELPPDHLHQSGIFLAFTKTQFEGRDIDFWNLAGGKGRVRFKELKSMASGPVFGRIQTVQEHVDLTAPGETAEIGKATGGKVALVENWDVCIWPSGWKSGYWLLDITTRIQCASDSPLILPEYHYGGMAIRAAREWTPQHVNFLTSEGDERIKGNHTRPRWCEIYGEVGGKPAGVALLTHPSNFRFPEPLRIHPTMPYMVYTPSFLGSWEVRPGTTLESRYRFVIHDGQMPAETLERLWRDFAEPLAATIKN